ncbi:tripartite tricarboxylate transporter permease [Chachezhania antarctica]|uniref:tripartite tricarboxylate transporter permease n=1 Tax=Chachezhania antarctica TaxID=2340860 RepID=UPI000EAEBE06|nr:tripartite tricarboxylate transporter permease [Chachezhania antarctica]|tara:strand:- start:3331 stop:4854 length:1524 start_codon:yes stop_codon:yes gene_type:complete
MVDLIAGFDLLLTPAVLFALLIGSIGGVIIGAIPGVGAPVAIAILLPATFSMEPIVGLTMLLGIYGSSMYGGSLPAILINTPGTAVNALTTYDGHPMTKRGEALRALGLAYGASFVGGILSIAALILLSPVLARIAPMFGSREIFLAALLGIVLVVIAHRGQTFAAGSLAAFGILLSTIGLEPVRYTQRFTFGFDFLSSGVDLIVVVLGLFALSQGFLLATQPDEAPKGERVVGNMFKAMTGVFRHKRIAAAGSGFGVLMGMIPGVGEFTAQFLTYTYARKTSKTPDEFGNGSPEGLVASESANNAVPAAAMIPLLALGIPGEALTAMMLSVFYVHNVVPGPGLFQNQLDFVYALFMSMMLLNVVVVVFVGLSSNMLMRIIRIPTRFLGMTILTLGFVGVYSLRNSITDCAIAAGFGMLGLVLKRQNLPTVPIILGMVLGGIMEVKLRSAMARVKTPLDFVDRPIAAMLAAAIVLLIVIHIWGIIRERRATSPEDSHDHDIHNSQQG